VSDQVEETLAWEAEQRPRAAITAIAGGVLTLLGSIMLLIILDGIPSEEDGFISLTEGLGAAVAGQEPAGPSLVVARTEYYGDNVALLSLATVLGALAAVAAGLILLYLYRATAARSELVGRLPWYAAIAGIVMFPLGHLMGQIGMWVGAATLDVDESTTASEAGEIFTSGVRVTGQFLEFFGTFALALAFVLIALNAMRVGLLTRFLGILGILVGALMILPLDQPQVVRAFWLIGVGLMLSGRSPVGTPPAWQSGRAEPWPSNQQIREAREAARRAAGEAPDDEGGAGGGPATKAGKRKRKRRR
jgi:hypothetical protein